MTSTPYSRPTQLSQEPSAQQPTEKPPTSPTLMYSTSEVRSNANEEDQIQWSPFLNHLRFPPVWKLVGTRSCRAKSIQCNSRPPWRTTSDQGQSPRSSACDSSSTKCTIEASPTSAAQQVTRSPTCSYPTKLLDGHKRKTLSARYKDGR